MKGHGSLNITENIYSFSFETEHIYLPDCVKGYIKDYYGN